MHHPVTSQRWIAFFLLSTVLTLPGCGSGGPPPPKRHLVTGTVTLDGQPVENGLVKLLGLKGEGGGDAGQIKGGKFSLEATSGEKRVEITATGSSGKTVTGKDGVQEAVSLIPEKYNLQSELKETVKEGKNDFKFDLKSK